MTHNCPHCKGTGVADTTVLVRYLSHEFTAKHPAHNPEPEDWTYWNKRDLLRSQYVKQNIEKFKHDE